MGTALSVILFSESPSVRMSRRQDGLVLGRLREACDGRTDDLVVRRLERTTNVILRRR